DEGRLAAGRRRPHHLRGGHHEDSAAALAGGRGRQAPGRRAAAHHGRGAHRRGAADAGRAVRRGDEGPLRLRLAVMRSGPIRVAAIEVSHWHSLWDAAYLTMLAAMPDVTIVGVQDPNADVAANRAAVLGNPPVFTDYRAMLAEMPPDLFVARGQHRRMAETAHYLLDHGYPFMMEKPMGLDGAEGQGVADKAAARRSSAAVPLPQRHSPFVARAQRMLDDRAFGPLSHIYLRLNRPTSARYPAWDSAWMLDPALAGGVALRNLGSRCFALFLPLTGEAARVTGAQLSRRVYEQPVEDYASVQL